MKRKRVDRLAKIFKSIMEFRLWIRAKVQLVSCAVFVSAGVFLGKNACRGRFTLQKLYFCSRLALLTGPLLAAANCPAQRPAPTASQAEQRLFLATNIARENENLPLLQWNDALAQAARGHVEWVVENAQLSHQYSGEPDLAVRVAQTGGHFQEIAENIAVGASADSIQSQWMNSPPHRRNILDPNLNAIGFAVVRKGQSLYAVADFERAVPSLSLDQTESVVDKLLLAQGLEMAGSRQDARQTCEMTHGTAGGSSPAFVMRWQSSDLSRLPPALEDRIRSSQYRVAAVGGCPSANAESGFTTYRIAVLLY